MNYDYLLSRPQLDEKVDYHNQHNLPSINTRRLHIKFFWADDQTRLFFISEFKETEPG